jgi:glycerol dehydrogenase-like iron-containing ADH family enzyme
MQYLHEIKKLFNKVLTHRCEQPGQACGLGCDVVIAVGGGAAAAGGRTLSTHLALSFKQM